MKAIEFVLASGDRNAPSLDRQAAYQFVDSRGFAPGHDRNCRYAVRVDPDAAEYCGRILEESRLERSELLDEGRSCVYRRRAELPRWVRLADGASNHRRSARR
jgi:hypothetical protein